MGKVAGFSSGCRLFLIACWALVVSVGTLSAEDTVAGPRSGMHTSVGLAVPIAPQQSLNFGAGLGFDTFDTIPFLPFLATDVELSCVAYPVAPATLANISSGDVLGSFSCGVGLVGRFDLGRWLRLCLGGSVGGALDLPPSLVGSPLTWYWAGSAGLDLKLSESFAFTLDARYTSIAGLAQVFTTGLGMEAAWPSDKGQPTRREDAAGRPQPAARSRQPVERGPFHGGTHPLPFDDSTPLALLASGEIPALTENVKSDPARYLQNLSEELVRSGDDDFRKVRALHDWVATNIAYDADAFYGKSPTVTDPLAVIRRGASVCQGYAEVFQLMCRYAGFECVIVSGYGRGVGFDPMKDISSSFDSNHAWNAVRIGGSWYLVDCTWDSGNVNPATQSFQRDYGTRYLFADPRGFLHTHYPEREEWQLVEKPLSFRQFCALPYLEGAFFQAGLSAGPEVLLVNKVADRFSFSLDAPEGTDVVAFMEAASSSGFGEPQKVYSRRDGTHVRFDATFPGPGAYCLSVCVATPGKESGTRVFSEVGELRVVASGGTPLVYPSVEPDAVRAQIAFQGEMPYDPRVRDEIVLPFTVPAGVRIAADLSSGSGVSTKFLRRRTIIVRDGERLAVHATFPAPGEYHVNIFLVTKEGDKQVWHQAEDFPVTVAAGTKREFPETYTPYYEEGWSLVAPLSSPIARGTRVPIEIEPPAGSSLADGAVQAIVNGKWTPMKRGEDGRFRAMVKAEGDKLSLYVKDDGKGYSGLLDYDIREVPGD